MYGPTVDDAARAHALAEFPKESVGLVVDGVYVAAINCAADPERDFAIPNELMLTPGLQALVHSHPHGDYSPSLKDMEQQDAMQLPWGIVACSQDETLPVFWWGGDVPRPPLLRRAYRFGPSGSDGKGDCYAVIRDWFLETKGIELKEVPRDLDSYRAEVPWYDTLFDSYGWVEIPPSEVLPGDVMLMKIKQSVSNHAMLVCENGLGLHHMENSLSTHVPLGLWAKYRTRCLRYGGEI